MRIKCPHCNGKGFSEINSALNMACGWCMGKGELDLEIVPTEPQTEAEIEKKWENTVWDTDVYLDDIDGKEPMTNEEWLKSLNTDEFADFLEGVAFDSNFRNGIEAEYRREDKDYCYGDRPKIIKAWLKEVHK